MCTCFGGRQFVVNRCYKHCNVKLLLEERFVVDIKYFSTTNHLSNTLTKSYMILGNNRYCPHTNHFPKSVVGTEILTDSCQQNIARAVCGENQIWLIEKCGGEDGKCKIIFHFEKLC